MKNIKYENILTENKLSEKYFDILSEIFETEQFDSLTNVKTVKLRQ